MAKSKENKPKGRKETKHFIRPSPFYTEYNRDFLAFQEYIYKILPLYAILSKKKRRYFMPFVRIDLFEGRTEEQKVALAREVAEVVSKNTNAPLSAIHVIIKDLPEGTYYPQGEMKKK